MRFDAAAARRARADFPALAREEGGQPLAWFDAPGGTQVPQCVIDAAADTYGRCNVNLGGAFATSREAAALVAATRDALADFLGAPSPACLSLGANMTTLNFALARTLGRRLAPGDEVVITALDHEANRGPWQRLAEHGVVLREVPLAAPGVLDADEFARVVNARTRVIAVGIASNALGTVTDFAPVRALAARVGALTVVDAVHYAAHLPLDVQALDCDFLLCSAYKFYGPHVGVLYCRSGLLNTLDPDRLIVQHQEAPHRIETGTPNFAAFAGVTAALDYLAGFGSGATRRARLLDAMTAIADYEHALAVQYTAALQTLPGIVVHGPAIESSPRAPTVSFSRRAGVAALADYLGRHGIQVWHGHFYARRVVESLGLDAHGGLLRVGFALYNTPEEVTRLVTALHAAIESAL